VWRRQLRAALRQHEAEFQDFEQAKELIYERDFVLQFFRIVCREIRIRSEDHRHMSEMLAAHEQLLSERGVALIRAELEDIAATGGFRGGAGSMGNKWFAESAEDAAAWGKKFFNFDNEPIFTVRVRVPNSVADQMMRVPMLDGIGPARSAEGAVIDLINGQGSIDALGANAVP
jgi:hypothetical protein